MRKWVEIGRALGYPQCCIETFVARALSCDASIGTPLGHTGYIMCDACKDKPHHEIVEAIASRRRPELSQFPRISMSYKELLEVVGL